jgi:hypothetical protein
MPIDPGDSANTAFGITPFGYHGADHAADGHPGWDIEYRVGALVRAAAAGIVQSVSPDPSAPGRFTVQLEHDVSNHFYRTVYTNLATVAGDVAVNGTVRVGQTLGTPGTFGTSGALGVHFQLDDFEYYRETPHPNAVSPEPFLTANARAVFDGLWSRAAYVQELVESFPTNPRTLSFPASRKWTRSGGDGAAGIRFIRADVRESNYAYELLAESGTVIESGNVTFNNLRRPYPEIALVSPTSTRLGIYDLVSNELRLSLAPAGSARPTDLASATIYRTVQ